MVARFGLIYCLLLMVCFGASAQQMDFSIPERITNGIDRFEILGRNSQGTIFEERSRSNAFIEAFYSDLKPKWKKNIDLKEIGAYVEKIYLTGDSALVFYSRYVKGIYILRAVRMSDHFEILHPPVSLDSIKTYNYNDAPDISFAVSNDKTHYLAYYIDDKSVDKREAHGCVLNASTLSVKNYPITLTPKIQPFLISAVVDDSAQAWFLVGDVQVKNFKNNFRYQTLQVFHYNELTKTSDHTDFFEEGKLMTEPVMRMDWVNHRLIIEGLYAFEAGNRSNGLFYFSLSTLNGQPVEKIFKEHSSDLLASLSGNNPPKRSDGFFDFKPQELIVKKDGGSILMTESFSDTTEYFSNPGYGGFGVSGPLTVSYYHFDDIIVTNFDENGKIIWQKILRKKQHTEGDGGYYSGFCTYIGGTQLFLCYNDFVSGQADFSCYSITIDGDVDRKELFNGDRKGVLPVSQFGKQVSAHELLIPSVKKGYIQLVKITF